MILTIEDGDVITSLLKKLFRKLKIDSKIYQMMLYPSDEAIKLGQEASVEIQLLYSLF